MSTGTGDSERDLRVGGRRVLAMAVLCCAFGCNDRVGGAGEEGVDTESATDTDADSGHEDPTCPPHREPTVLVAGLGNLRPHLTLDDDELFFVDGWRVLAVPKSGGETREAAIASAPIRGMGVDESHVYWTEIDGVYRVPKEGGATERLTEQPTADMVLVGNEVYFSAYLDSEIGAVPKAGGEVTTKLATPDVGVTTTLRRHGSLVSFVNTSTVPVGGLWEIDSVQGTSVLLAQPEHTIRDLHADAEHLYLTWETGQGLLRLARTPNAELEVVAETEGAPWMVTTDESRIFWTDDALYPQAGGYAGRVMCMTRGETTPVTIGEYETLAAAMRVDGSGLYWSVFGDDARVSAVLKLDVDPR